MDKDFHSLPLQEQRRLYRARSARVPEGWTPPPPKRVRGRCSPKPTEVTIRRPDGVIMKVSTAFLDGLAQGLPVIRRKRVVREK